MKTLTIRDVFGDPLTVNIKTDGAVFAVTKNPAYQGYAVTHKATGGKVAESRLLARARKLHAAFEAQPDWATLSDEIPNDRREHFLALRSAAYASAEATP